MTADLPDGPAGIEDAADDEALWSAARHDDLRRIADLARRLFAAPMVTIVSARGVLQHGSGEAAEDAPMRDAPLLIEGEAGPPIGSLRIHGERAWNDGDLATLDDIAACLCGLIASRRAPPRPEPAPAPVPAETAVHPFRPGEPAARSDAAIERTAAEPGEGGSRILLADDLDLNRKLISDMLALDGHAVDSVADGEAAVQAASEHSYDLILMDMIMPVMDGMAATRAIRALPSPACDVPIVALTAYSLPDQLDSCMKAGVDAVLIKPMSVAALNEAIATWTGRRRAA